MFSYTRIILDNTELAIYRRGLEYANKKKIRLISVTNNGCQAIADGSQNYEISLGFSHVGSPKFSCSCPYFSEHKTKIVCKHIIGSSLIWDRSRNIPDPDKGTIDNLVIPEPDFTAKDINAAFKDPLIANLDILRADPAGWMRPHARLPIKPKVCNESALTVEIIKQGISELRAWSRKSNFDPYFCAGEIMAGFCELMRFIKSKFNSLSLEDKIKTLKILADFHHELILEKIDDSDGLHDFSEAHLFDLVNEFIVKNKLNTLQKETLDSIRAKIKDY